MWQLWRQDDNGQKFLVEAFPEREPAESLLRALEARGHKQTYWLVPVPGLSEGEDPGSTKRASSSH